MRGFRGLNLSRLQRRRFVRWRILSKSIQEWSWRPWRFNDNWLFYSLWFTSCTINALNSIRIQSSFCRITINNLKLALWSVTDGFILHKISACLALSENDLLVKIIICFLLFLLKKKIKHLCERKSIINRDIKIHVYSKRHTWICTLWPSFSLNCC